MRCLAISGCEARSFGLQGACASPTRVTVLDHHKTAAENLAGAAAPNLEVTLDMERSGAIIARDHFAPHGLTDAQQAWAPL